MKLTELKQLIQETIDELSTKSSGVEEFLAHAKQQKYPFLQFPSFGDLQDYVLDATGREFQELKDEAGLNENFFISENKVNYYIDKDGNEFQTLDVNYLQYPGNVTVKYVGSSDPMEYKGNFEADLKSGIIKRLGSKIDEAFFIGENKTIECGKCGWRWELEDNGGVNDNPYLCHKCDYDNSYRYNDDIDEYDVENVDDIKEFLQFMKEYKQTLAEANCGCVYEAEYRGREVSLGKPMQGDIKKFKVYVKNPKGKVVKVNFGAHGMNIKKNNPVRRKAYRARHHCDNPGPRHKANYWSCRKW